MEKSLANVPRRDATVNNNQSTNDETTSAVSMLTSMMKNSRSTSPESNNFNQNVIYLFVFGAPKTANSIDFYLLFSFHLQIENSVYEIHTFNGVGSNDELQRNAEEILNGVKRAVEVQTINSPEAISFHESSMLGKSPFQNERIKKHKILSFIHQLTPR